MASITINDRSIQPPSSNQKPNSGDEEIAKGLAKDKLTVGLAEETTPVNDEVQDELPKLTVSETQWLAKSRAAFDSSTSFFNDSVRGKLDDSIRAFHSQHRSGSHFSTTTNQFSSKVYRPKTRSVIDKYEAAADAAYFSNPDVISIEAENPSDPKEVVSAVAVKALMQYRLTKSVPWYQIVIGGFQDAQVQGLAVAHYYWKVKVEDEIKVEGGTETKTKKFAEDKPAVELVPLENFRFDPNASWLDIVGTSPYLIHLRPMYIGEVKEKIKSGFFKDFSDNELIAAQSSVKEGGTTRTARSHSSSDPVDRTAKEVSDYELILVQEHIHRVDGQDWVWYTINNTLMLRDPVMIEELYFTGKRQYVVGSCVLETHNTYVSSTPTKLSGIQEELNEVANQRLNNVKLALNKKFIVKTDSEIDLSALLRNQPGSAVFTQNPTEDVRELSTPDVTQSSYLEQDRLNADFDELAGNFSPQTIQTSKQPGGAETWRGMQMLNSNANVSLEHQLRIFTDTFVVPLLRGIIQLEVKYETDDMVMALVGKQANLMRYGVDAMTDEMLKADLVVKCNVGMNATDPTTKMGKLTAVIGTLQNIMKMPSSRMFDMKELSKEMFANAGYGDGMRFINQEQDPNMIQIQQENQMLKMKLMKGPEAKGQIELQKARENNQTKLAIASQHEKVDAAKFMATHAFEVANQPVGQPQGAPGMPGATPPGAAGEQIPKQL